MKRSFDFYGPSKSCYLNDRSDVQLSSSSSYNFYKKIKDQCDCFQIKPLTFLNQPWAKIFSIQQQNINFQNEDYCKQVCLNNTQCR